MCFTDKGKVVNVKARPLLNFVGQDDPPGDVRVGWRGWKVKDGTLASPMMNKDWEPGKPMRGDKIKSGEKTGVYAFKTIKDLIEYTHVSKTGKDMVIGLVVLWGDVAEHDKGYRAENAYPFKIWTNDPMIQSTLRDKYKASVERARATTLSETKVAA